MLTGAGIFIVENYKNNLVAILFGNKGHDYNEPGGSIDPGETPEETACRETREESANLIQIKPHELKQISIPILYKRYMSYIIYINKISARDHYHNVKLVFSKCKPHCWKENSSMVRIDLQKLIKNSIINKNIMRDIDGNFIRVRQRTLGVVKQAINIFSKLRHSIYLHQNVTFISRMPCLIGTYTYTLQQNIPQIQQIQQKSKSYAIYAVPNFQNKDKFLHNCNIKWGGLHVTLAGFSQFHPQIKPFLQMLSKAGRKFWFMDINTIKLKNNTIYFNSATLDKIANALNNNGFQKIKGKQFSGVDWHITFINCQIPHNIINILANISWSFIIVRDNGDGTYSWLEKYDITRV
jgi:hypothetical protein